MAHTKKRVISILAAAALTCCTLPQNSPLLLRPAVTASAAASSGTCGENLTWTFDDSSGTLTVSGTGEMDNYSNISPSPWRNLNYKITNVMVEKGATSIGNWAFSDCVNLTTVTIPDSITTIGGMAFDNTLWLKSKQDENPLVIINGILIDGKTCSGDIMIPSNVASIGNLAFYRCLGLTSITIPSSVTSIEEYAFSSCSDLTSITIPESVTSIGDAAFIKCSSLTTISIPDGVVSIGKNTFSECTGLSSITIPGSVTNIGKSAFEKCSGLTSITIPDGVTSIGEMAFCECSNLTNISISESVTSIGERAFRKCSSLTSIIIPIGVTSLGKELFYSCSNMTNIEIPNSVSEIGEAAFYGCTGLTDITIPVSVTSIGKYTFVGCTNLTAISIPNSVTSIGESAFDSCSALTEITIPNSVTSISKSAFAGCSDLTIYGYPGSFAETYANTYGFPFVSLVEPKPSVYDGMQYIAEDDHIIITGYTEDLPAVLEIPAEIDGMPVTGFAQFAFAHCAALREVTLPDTVTAFGMQTFLGCENLEKVTLPSTLKSIYESAFAQCTSLTSVTIPDGCETIGNLVFAGCSSLTEVNIPASVVNFFEPAFGGTPWLEAKQAENPLVAVNGILIDASAASGEVTVPDDVTVINSYAFMDCDAITKITVPAGVAKIGGISSAALTDVIILNPACEIADEEAAITNGYDPDAEKMNYLGTIHGYDGSTAEEYANRYGYTFESLGAAPEGPVSDWAEKSVISKNTDEAELVVRVGDIDACNDENAVSDHGYDPFTAKSQYAHGYPWQKDDTDPDGTDRIFVGSHWEGVSTDGYSSNYAAYKNGEDDENAYGDGALTLTMEYDASGIEIENVLLQLCIDDFQALSWESNFTVTLNGKDAPFIAELLNHTDQTGPTAYIVSAMIPSGFFADIAAGKLTVVIDETTGVGDGYAIDFARLLINYDDQIFTGTFSGKTEPGATVRLLGTSTTVTASDTGAFSFGAVPGINAVRASKTGFVEGYAGGIVLSTGTEWSPEVMLTEGEGSPDIDFSKFAATGLPVRGDYNADGELTVADAVLLARYLAEDTGLTGEQIAEILIHEPDFNGDDAATILDVRALLKLLSTPAEN